MMHKNGFEFDLRLQHFYDELQSLDKLRASQAEQRWETVSFDTG
jgi:hypothetical protein